MALIHGLTIPEILQLIDIKKEQKKQVILHPNGFLQVSLHDDRLENSTGLRFHVWPEEYLPIQNKEFKVHDHIFDYESDVVLGVLGNYLYNVKENKDGERVLFVPPRKLSKDISNTLINTGIRVQSRLESIQYVRAGERYGLAKQKFHTTTVHASPTATIVKIKNAEDTVPRIVGPRVYNQEDLTFDRLGFNQEKAWAMISNIEDMIRKEYYS